MLVIMESGMDKMLTLSNPATCLIRLFDLYSFNSFFNINDLNKKIEADSFENQSLWLTLETAGIFHEGQKFKHIN